MRQLTTLVALLVALVFGGTASAGPITSFGTNSSPVGMAFTPTPSTGFTTSNGTVGQITAGSTFTGNVAGNTLYGATFSNLSFNVLNVNAPNGSGTLSVLPPVPSTFQVSLGGNTAIFNILNPASFNVFGSNPSNFLNLTVPFALVSSTFPGTTDFGPIGQIWNFSFTIAASITLVNGTPGSITFNNSSGPGISVSATGLFVPEPATLAICGIFGIAGLVTARRKLKKSVEPTVAA